MKETLVWYDVSLGLPAHGALVLAQDAEGEVFPASLTKRGNWADLLGTGEFLNPVRWAEWPKGPQE